MEEGLSKSRKRGGGADGSCGADCLGRIPHSDGLTALSVLAKAHVPMKELWCVCKELDAVVPRGIVIGLHTPQEVENRLLDAHTAGRYPVVKASLAREGAWLQGGALTRLPRRLRELRFTGLYNKAVTFPAGCVFDSIIFGEHFNQPVVIPPGTKSAAFGFRFDSSVTLLEGLETIRFGTEERDLGSRFRQPLHVPNGIKRVLFHPRSHFDRRLDLPASVEELQLGPGFNQPLDLPAGLQVLSFSDYDSEGPNRLLSMFNEPLLLPAGIKKLRLAYRFTQPLHLPNGMEEVFFSPGSLFDQPLHLPVGLRTIEFGHAYTQPLDLPAGLEVLKFWRRSGKEEIPDNRFNHPLIFPNSMREICLNHEFDQPLGQLPEGLQALTLGDAFRQPLHHLPAGLQSLTVGTKGMKVLDVLPVLGEDELSVRTYRFKPSALPAGLKRLEFGGQFYLPVDLPDHVAEVSFTGYSGQMVGLPASGNLKKLTLPCLYNHPLEGLSGCVGLEELEFGTDFNQPVELPPGLQHVKFSQAFQQPIMLPEGMLSATFHESYQQPVEVSDNETWVWSMLGGGRKVYKREVGV